MHTIKKIVLPWVIVAVMNALQFVALTIVASGTLCLAQSSVAVLTGVVVDGADAPVADAAVVLTDAARAYERKVRTGSDGRFVIEQLPPSEYRVRAAAPNFNAAEITNVILRAGERNAIQLRLDVAARSEAIEVRADAPVVRESPSVATSIPGEIIRNQPLNGRSLQSLIELSPGVVITPANLVTPGQFSVNGQRATANYFTVDGVSANFGTSASVTPYENGGTVPSFSALGSTASLASLEAVQEFSVQTSTYAPEYGRQPGAQVAVVTRSGTNSYHGTLYEYLRNNVLDANNFFANANGLPRRALRANNFGFVLGGPVTIPKVYRGSDRTFFFVSYEGMRLRTPFVTDPLQVPSLGARQRATGTIRDLLNAFPLPTGPAFTNDPDAAPYLSSFSNPSSLDATSVRIDHRFSDRVSAFGRVHYAPSENQERAKFCAASCVSVTSARTVTATFGVPWLISTAVTNDVRLNVSRSRTGLSYFMDNFGGATIPPVTSLYPSFTTRDQGYIYVEVDPSGNNTLSDGLFVNNRNQQINLVETLSWVKGSHSFRFGFDYRRLAPVSDSGSYRRQFRYTSVSQLAGDIAPGVTLFAPSVPLEPRYTNYSAFLQDTWRLRPGITLTYGVRYEVAPAPGEANGRLPATLIHPDRPAEFALAPAGQRFYPTTWNNLAPRVGASWQPWNGRDLIVRAGFGVFHDLGYGFAGNAFSTSLTPYARSLNLTNVAYTSPLGAQQPPAADPAAPLARVFAYEDGFQLPYSLQYSFAVEHGVTSRDVVTLSYVGATGRRLTRLESLRRLSVQFPRIDAVRNSASSDYHSLQAQYRRRFSRGLQAIASYTWGKSLDTASEESINNFQAPSSRTDPGLDRGPSSFDVRHSFNAAATWELPSPAAGPLHRIVHGFAVDGIVRARTAAPLNVLTNRDPFGLGFATVSRPDLLPGVPLYLKSESLPGGKRVNAAAFDGTTPVTAGRQGTLGRNVLRGFGLFQTDVSVRRQFTFRERIGIQFRLDAFNVFNRSNFANPSGILTSSTFGIATQTLSSGLAGLNPLFQTGGPRSLQVSLKFQF